MSDINLDKFISDINCIENRLIYLNNENRELKDKIKNLLSLLRECSEENFEACNSGFGSWDDSSELQYKINMQINPDNTIYNKEQA